MKVDDQDGTGARCESQRQRAEEQEANAIGHRATPARAATRAPCIPQTEVPGIEIGTSDFVVTT